MSLENIIKYATNTPMNTNPAVMSSVVSKSFKETKDEILNEAKAYSDSKGGYTESGKVYTFDGDTTGHEIGYYNGIQFVMLADEYFDPNHIEHITVSVGGSLNELNKSQHFWVVDSTEAGITGHVIFTEWQGSDIPIVLIQKDDNSGQETFGVLADPKYQAYVTRVELAEAIVPIDKKYLPGCLPVVKITTEFNESTVQLSATENAVLEAACGSPIIVNFVNCSTLYSYMNGNGIVLFAPVDEAMCAHWFVKTETGWVASTDV